MQSQITAAFAALDAKMLTRQMAWASARRAAVLTVQVEPGKWYSARKADAEIIAAGGKAWAGILKSGAWRDLVAQNVAGLIAKRDVRIIAALTKAGITELPEFQLTECSDGVEGSFTIAGHRITIRTILAGGFNIQCLHQRVLVTIA